MRLLSKLHSLKQKVLLIFVATVCIFFITQGIVYFGVYKIFIEKQEQFYAVKIAVKVQNIIKKVNNEVESLCIDWSAWDSMYKAVTKGWSESFESEAFPPGSSFLFDINFVGILKGKNYIFSRSYKSGLKDNFVSNFQLPVELIEKLEKEVNDEPFSAFVKTPEGILFVCINRITTSDGSRMSDGYLIMGRFMSDFIWKKISDIILEDISFIEDPDFVKDKGYSFVKFHKIWLKKFKNHMCIVFDLKDMENRTLGYIEIDTKREISAYFYKSTIFSSFLTLGIFLILIFILIVFFEKTLVSRIKNLADAMNSVELGKPIETDFTFNNDEIGLLEKSFTNMVERIYKQEKEREEMQEKLSFFQNMVTAGKITYQIIHEINNPVRVIKNCLYAMENDKNSKNYNEYYDLLKKEINRLSQITQEMLDFSTVPKLFKEDIDISFLIKDIIKSIKTAYRDRNVEINVSFLKKDRILIVKGDANKLKQVFINIIRNGLEASGFEYPINIVVDLDKDLNNVIISICDQGEGIEHTKVERLFEPFYSNKEKGLGLGLSIAYNIIRNHNGFINVKPNKPKGACFEIILPLKRGNYEA